MASRAAYMSACFIGFQISGFRVCRNPMAEILSMVFLLFFQDLFPTCIKES
ncbi:hypothetical protein HanPI659440_Chr17g0699041 [Helianthus annuus]|nr:hypothetical protein HanPI659440_Chr17g0699041 [Helianthus annuus]